MRSVNRRQPIRHPAILVLALLALAGLPAAAQNLEQEIFGETDAIRADAKAVDAPLLSPGNYRSGTENYDRAKRDFEAGRNLERIKSRLTTAANFFRKAIENASMAAITFRPAIESRADAITAKASRRAARDWESAEETFDDATRALEKGDLKKAQALGVESDQLYRLAELNAIKTLHLSQARSLIAEADRQKVDKFAPETLARARSLLAQADAALDADRYDTAEPVRLAAKAEYEARHASYLATVARRVREDELSIEQLILNWEAPLARAAEAAGLNPDFSAGHRSAGQRLAATVRALREERDTLQSEIDERRRVIIGLEEELHELDERLGGASRERASLVRELQERTRVEEQFAQVSDMFGPDEAIVLRDESRLIMRLVGLNFASGSARLGADAAGIMDKVRDAVNIFPRSELLVEGHTDSLGGAEQNLALSKRRAQSVVDYLVNRIGIPAWRIKAIGYGDARPISNNKTAEGREKNRRIDLILTPR